MRKPVQISSSQDGCNTHFHVVRQDSINKKMTWGYFFSFQYVLVKLRVLHEVYTYKGDDGIVMRR